MSLLGAAFLLAAPAKAVGTASADVIVYGSTSGGVCAAIAFGKIVYSEGE